MTMYYSTCDSPVGELLLVAGSDALIGVYMADHRPAVAAVAGPVDGAADQILAEAKRQLSLYFAGKLREFDLPLAMNGTEFQRAVWDELKKIPYGTTISYGELARRVGNPNSSRAVGLANGRNPISIIVPCHRVIGADGRLTGYGGGLPRKEILLSLEARVVSAGLPAGLVVAK